MTQQMGVSSRPHHRNMGVKCANVQYHWTGSPVGVVNFVPIKILVPTKMIQIRIRIVINFVGYLFAKINAQSPSSVIACRLKAPTRKKRTLIV